MNENLFEEIAYSNNIPEDDFDGLSPNQIHELLYGEIGTGIVKINEIKEEKTEIPILKQIFAFLEIVIRENGIKLTPAGYLPVKIIKELYDQRILMDEDIESGITKLSSEGKSLSIHLTRIISELSGFVRKYKGKLLITNKGNEFIKQNGEKYWLKDIIDVFGNKFSMAYFDNYKNEHVGQIGFMFSIYLMKKYGDIERDSDFYAKKYFKAFPRIGEIEENYNKSAYATRTFERFMEYFGFIKIIRERRIEKKYKKTKLFDKYIKIEE